MMYFVLITKITILVLTTSFGLISKVEGCIVPSCCQTTNSNALKNNEIMEEKVCTKCGKTKPREDFGKHKGAKDGLNWQCKNCSRGASRSYRTNNKEEFNKSIEKYRRTKEGLISRIYSAQRANSIRRGHAMPEYSRAELQEWCFSQELFHELYDNWVESGYSKMMKPSCDRTDDFLPYSIARLKLMTWHDNKEKSNNDKIIGVDNRLSTAVIATNILTGEETEYFSQSSVARDIGISQTLVSRCCLGKTKQSLGYMFRFKKSKNG